MTTRNLLLITTSSDSINVYVLPDPGGAFTTHTARSPRMNSLSDLITLLIHHHPQQLEHRRPRRRNNQECQSLFRIV